MKIFFEKGVIPELEESGTKTYQEFIYWFSKYSFKKDDEIFLFFKENGTSVDAASSNIDVMKRNASRRFYVDMEMKDFFEKFGAKTLFVDSEGVLTFKRPECSDADSDCYDCN